MGTKWPLEGAEAIKAIALHRHVWVETPVAKAVMEAATAEVLRPSIQRLESEAAAGAGVHAASALARARKACLDPPQARPEREALDVQTLTTQVLANPRLTSAEHSVMLSANSKVSSLWIDSSMTSVNVK